ncbi:MAG: NUDIX hydrolase [Patescibacteria group bacterium]
MKTINREIVSAIIISSDRKILMGQKDPKKGGVYADCWHIPGGGVDEGEDKITALKRELKEEVGIDVSTYQTDLIDTEGFGESVKNINGEDFLCKMKFNVYKIKIPKSSHEINIYTSDDLIVLKWIEIEKLSGYKITPPSSALFQRVHI